MTLVDVTVILQSNALCGGKQQTYFFLFFLQAGEEKMPWICLCADIRRGMEQDWMVWGRNAQWHTGVAWVGTEDDMAFSNNKAESVQWNSTDIHLFYPPDSILVFIWRQLSGTIFELVMCSLLFCSDVNLLDKANIINILIKSTPFDFDVTKYLINVF